MFQKHLEADGAVMRKNIQESTKTEEAMSDFTLMPWEDFEQIDVDTVL